MVIVSKFDGKCRQCGQPHHVGEKVDWVKTRKGVTCLDCLASSMGGGPMVIPTNPQTGFTAPSPYRNRGYVTYQGINRATSPWWQSTSNQHPAPQPGSQAWNNLFGGGPLNPQPPLPVKPKPTLEGLILTALVALEEAILEAATKSMTPEMQAGWDKYQKLKAMALAPGSKGEERNALKLATLQAVKLAF